MLCISKAKCHFVLSIYIPSLINLISPQADGCLELDRVKVMHSERQKNKQIHFKILSYYIQGRTSYGNKLNCGFLFCVWCFVFGFGFAVKEESNHHFVNKWRFMLYTQGVQVKIRK